MGHSEIVFWRFQRWDFGNLAGVPEVMFGSYVFEGFTFCCVTARIEQRLAVSSEYLGFWAEECFLHAWNWWWRTRLWYEGMHAQWYLRWECRYLTTWYFTAIHQNAKACVQEVVTYTCSDRPTLSNRMVLIPQLEYSGNIQEYSYCHHGLSEMGNCENKVGMGTAVIKADHEDRHALACACDCGDNDETVYFRMHFSRVVWLWAFANALLCVFVSPDVSKFPLCSSLHGMVVQRVCTCATHFFGTAAVLIVRLCNVEHEFGKLCERSMSAFPPSVLRIAFARYAAHFPWPAKQSTEIVASEWMQLIWRIVQWSTRLARCTCCCPFPQWIARILSLRFDMMVLRGGMFKMKLHLSSEQDTYLGWVQFRPYNETIDVVTDIRHRFLHLPSGVQIKLRPDYDDDSTMQLNCVRNCCTELRCHVAAMHVIPISSDHHFCYSVTVLCTALCTREHCIMSLWRACTYWDTVVMYVETACAHTPYTYVYGVLGWCYAADRGGFAFGAVQGVVLTSAATCLLSRRLKPHHQLNDAAMHCACPVSSYFCLSATILQWYRHFRLYAQWSNLQPFPVQSRRQEAPTQLSQWEIIIRGCRMLNVVRAFGFELQSLRWWSRCDLHYTSLSFAKLGLFSAWS